jgi:hypothetical protein
MDLCAAFANFFRDCKKSQRFRHEQTTRLPVLYWIADSTSFGASYSTRQRCAAGK